MKHHVLLTVALLTSLSAPMNAALAQYGAPVAQAGSSQNGAVVQTTRETPIAMDGYCPVTIVEQRRWVKGDEKFAVRLDGRTYLFPSQSEKDRYLSNTVRYTPALSGDCIVTAVDGGKRVAGSVRFSALHQSKLYLFPSDKEKQAFMDAPEKYENTDLILGGMCVVSKFEMQKDVPGKEEFGTVYGGMRFLFPSIEQKRKFLSNPQKYMPK